MSVKSRFPAGMTNKRAKADSPAGNDRKKSNHRSFHSLRSLRMTAFVVDGMKSKGNGNNGRAFVVSHPSRHKARDGCGTQFSDRPVV